MSEFPPTPATPQAPQRGTTPHGADVGSPRTGVARGAERYTAKAAQPRNAFNTTEGWRGE